MYYISKRGGWLQEQSATAVIPSGKIGVGVDGGVPQATSSSIPEEKGTTRIRQLVKGALSLIH